MTVRVAIVGCGIAGRARARAVHAHPDTELVAVHRGRFAEDLGAPVVGEDAVISAAEVVVVASPSETHPAWVRRALEAGRDVIVEYPLARTGEEARALLDLAARLGRLLHVEHIERLTPTTPWLTEQVSQHGWSSATLSFTSGGEPWPDAEAHAWSQVSRLHRLTAVLGWPEHLRVDHADGGRIDATLTWEGGRNVGLRFRRGSGLERGLHLRVDTPAGVRDVVGRRALADGEPVDLPASTLFLDDLDHALRRRAGQVGPYVPDDALVALLDLANALGSPDPSGRGVKAP